MTHNLNTNESFHNLTNFWRNEHIIHRIIIETDTNRNGQTCFNIKRHCNPQTRLTCYPLSISNNSICHNAINDERINVCHHDHPIEPLVLNENTM
jgi:hypothetical protein